MKGNSETYLEIEALKSYFDKFNIEISRPNEVFRKDLFFVNLSINGQLWKILVDDEYQDFATNNPLVCLFLVFNSLESYKESSDFLTFCKLHNVDPSDVNWLEYYRSLDTIYQEIRKKIGKIDPCISPYDYNLRTGVIQSLMNNNTSR
jgi:hypothetical protein